MNFRVRAWIRVEKSECESESEEKRSGSEMGFLTPTLTPALFSAPQAGLEPATL